MVRIRSRQLTRVMIVVVRALPLLVVPPREERNHSAAVMLIRPCKRRARYDVVVNQGRAACLCLAFTIFVAYKS